MISRISVQKSPLRTVTDQQGRSKPFDSMNNIVAHALIDLTASARFGGPLNVDINEVIIIITSRVSDIFSSLLILSHTLDCTF